jgi:uncharacterized protein YjfI (DUF2170 family)
MAKGIGRKINLGIAKEATRGTAEANATFWLQKITAALEEKKEFAQQEQSIGVIEDAIGADIVKAFAQGEFTIPVSDKTIGLILLATLGSVSTQANTPETGVNTHTFSVAQNAQHPSLTLFIDDTLSGQDYKHALGMIESLELKYERGKYIEATVNVRAKKGTTAVLTSSFTAENLFRSKDVTFKLASDLSGLDAASATQIKSLSLKIDKNLEDDDVLGSVDPVDFLNKHFVITGNFEAIWNSEAEFKTQFLAGAAKAMRIDLKNTDVTIGTSTNPQLQIDLAKVIFQELTRPFNNNDIVMQTLAFKGYYSLSDAKAIEAKLINTQSSY